MSALAILGIVLGSMLTYVIIGSAVFNYGFNHLEHRSDAGFGGGILGLFWPVTIWFVIGWALGSQPDNRERTDPFLWHLFTLPKPAARVAKSTRKELLRRSQINAMEDDLGLVRTRWEGTP